MKNLELQTMPGLVTETAQLRQDLAETRKEIEKRNEKFASLKEVGNEIATMGKEVTKAVMSVTKAWGHLLFPDALAREREVEIELLKERERTLDRSQIGACKDGNGWRTSRECVLR